MFKKSVNPYRPVARWGFSTILAMLLTGFLITLTAGVLYLFLSENRINQSLFKGAAAYHASEGALEYALLKLKNHREWFEDALQIDENEGGVLAEWGRPRDPRIGYRIESTGTDYSGTIEHNSFEIIPLFREKGKVLTNTNSIPWKSPHGPMKQATPAQFYDRESVSDFELQINSGDRLVWNVIGNDVMGNTFGISGILYSTLPASTPSGVQVSVGSTHASTVGTFRTYDAGILSETTKQIGSFLSIYNENYLVLFNPGSTAADYRITTSGSSPFTLPRTRITASGKVRDSIINLQITQDKTGFYDILKYSLFVPE